MVEASGHVGAPDLLGRADPLGRASPSAKRSGRRRFHGPAPGVVHAVVRGCGWPVGAAIEPPAVAELTGIAWATVGSIAERLVEEKLHEDRFENLRRIGVDEISYRKHSQLPHRRRGPRPESRDLGRRGQERRHLGRVLQGAGSRTRRAPGVASIDMSAGYEKALRAHAPQAEIVFDRFHVARLANDALTDVRREEANKLAPYERAALKGTRWILLKRRDASMPTKPPPWPRSSTPTRPCTAPACSRTASSTSSPPPTARPPNGASGNGSRGLAAHASDPSCVSAVPCANISTASSPSSIPGTYQCPPRGHEQQDPSSQPPGLRLPFSRSPHRYHLSLLLRNSASPATPDLGEPEIPRRAFVRPRRWAHFSGPHSTDDAPIEVHGFATAAVIAKSRRYRAVRRIRTTTPSTMLRPVSPRLQLSWLLLVASLVFLGPRWSTPVVPLS